MNTHHFDAEINRTARAAANLEPRTAAADRTVWSSAAETLRERVYRTEAGAVRLRVDWSARLLLQVTDERRFRDVRDLPSFVELFSYDAFLLFNLAVPGSFGGVITPLGGQYRVHPIILDAYLFESAWVAASRNAWPSIEPLPLFDVVAWYDSLQIRTQQLATTGVAKALFHLLHLSRHTDIDALSILRLALALESLYEAPSTTLGERIAALLGPSPVIENTLPRLFALRDAITGGSAPITHPMHDDVLDARVDDESLDWTEIADVAASIVIATIQARVREATAERLRRAS